MASHAEKDSSGLGRIVPISCWDHVQTSDRQKCEAVA